MATRQTALVILDAKLILANTLFRFPKILKLLREVVLKTERKRTHVVLSVSKVTIQVLWYHTYVLPSAKQLKPNTRAEVLFASLGFAHANTANIPKVLHAQLTKPKIAIHVTRVITWTMVYAKKKNARVTMDNFM
jgi:hypothetical protein